MTDYAKYAAYLQHESDFGNSSEALTAAIKLMYIADASSFNEMWALMEADGYQYGEEALQQVRFGWELACGARSRLAKELAELKRAATPKSPEEEREYCLTEADALLAAREKEALPVTTSCIADLLFDRCATARAEGYAQRKAEETRPCPACLGVVPESGCGRCFGSGAVAALRVEGDRLSAAQAEIAACNEAARMRTDAYAQLQTKLTEHDAEIARLRAEAVLTDSDKAFLDAVAAGVHERDALQTKLTNLRTAAERALHELNTSPSHGSYVARPILEDAVEASRK